MLNIFKKETIGLPANLLVFDTFLLNKKKRRAESPLLFCYYLLKNELKLRTDLTWTAKDLGETCAIPTCELDRIMLLLLRRVINSDSHSNLREEEGIFTKLRQQQFISFSEEGEQTILWLKDPDTIIRDLINRITTKKTEEHDERLIKAGFARIKGEPKKKYKKRIKLLTTQLRKKNLTFFHKTIENLEAGAFSTINLSLKQIYHKFNLERFPGPNDHRTLYRNMRMLEWSCFTLFETNDQHPRYNVKHPIWEQMKVIADIPIALEYPQGDKEKKFYDDRRNSALIKAQNMELGRCTCSFKTTERHGKDSGVCGRTIRNWVRNKNNFVKLQSQYQIINVGVNYTDLNLMLEQAEKIGCKTRVAYKFKKIVYDKNGKYSPKKLADVYVQIPNSVAFKPITPKIERCVEHKDLKHRSNRLLTTTLYYNHYPVRGEVPHITNGLERALPPMQEGYCTLNFAMAINPTARVLSKLFSEVSDSADRTSLRAHYTGYARTVRNKKFVILKNKRKTEALAM